jgi:hypothetical protein
MGTFCNSETLASTAQSTRRQNPEEHHKSRHRRENLKSHNAEGVDSRFRYSKTHIKMPIGG